MPDWTEGTGEETIEDRDLDLALGLSPASAAPAPDLFERVLGRIRPSGTPLASPSIVDPAAIEWRPSKLPGISTCLLFKDRINRQITQLVRMEPGASVPSHAHPLPEQCYVIQGDLCWAGRKVTAGQFFVTTEREWAPVSWTETGNVLLIVGSPDAVYA
jgi:hypothetical protein